MALGADVIGWQNSLLRDPVLIAPEADEAIWNVRRSVQEGKRGPDEMEIDFNLAIRVVTILGSVGAALVAIFGVFWWLVQQY